MTKKGYIYIYYIHKLLMCVGCEVSLSRQECTSREFHVTVTFETTESEAKFSQCQKQKKKSNVDKGERGGGGG